MSDVLRQAGTHRLRAALAAGRFAITIEYASPVAGQPFDRAVAPILVLAHAIRGDPRIAAIALTDRSRSDHDHDPVAIGHRVLEVSGAMPIVHLAGKDRSLHDLEEHLRRAGALGLDTFLLVTGDGLKAPPPERPVRYLDSVHALRAARQRSGACLLAAAVCPFKYREEDLLNQYLKAGKKLRAGADFLVTQIGWDMRKLEEARAVLAGRGYSAPLLAGLLFLTPGRCRRIRQVGLPGVTITDDLATKLEEESRAPDSGRDAAYRRLALQVVGARLMGYAGAQISGLHAYSKVTRLLDAVDGVSTECPTLEDWQRAWRRALTFADGRQAQVAPEHGLYLDAGTLEGEARPRPGESLQFRALDLIDRLAFHDGSPGARVVGPLVRGLGARFGSDGFLLMLELAIKRPLVGCRGCGFCRLPATAYVCPETCPKGLANGPCGGTRDGICEFGDRECIHNGIYRLSRKAGRLADLEEVLIPSVPEESRNTCSWVTHFQGGGMRPVKLGMVSGRHPEGRPR